MNTNTKSDTVEQFEVKDNIAHNHFFLFSQYGQYNWSLMDPADIWDLRCCLNIIFEQFNFIPNFKTLFQITAPL